jgi:hypothetical protein
MRPRLVPALVLVLAVASAVAPERTRAGLGFRLARFVARQAGGALARSWRARPLTDSLLVFAPAARPPRKPPW